MEERPLQAIDQNQESPLMEAQLQQDSAEMLRNESSPEQANNLTEDE